MTKVAILLRRLVTPLLVGMGMAAATLATSVAGVLALATAAGLFGFASHRAAVRLSEETAERPDRNC